MQNGPKYAVSKEGLIKLFVLLFGCTAFALFADSGGYSRNPEITWAFAAYIISWCITLLFYFFHVTGLAEQMSCGRGCTFDGFDFLWAWISTIHFLAASIAFAINVCDVTTNNVNCDKEAGSLALGFATFVCYAVEAYILGSHAPANSGYIASPKGWLKTTVLVGGAATFALMVDANFNWCWKGSCAQALTYSLSAFCIAWSVTVILFLANMFLPESKSSSKGYQYFHFAWLALSALFFLTGASCFAAFMECNEFERSPCSERLGGVIIGFATAVLYIIDAIVNRPRK